MISTAIKGTDTASGIDLTQLSSAGKSGGASFQKIMSKSLSSNVNNKASQNMVQTKTASGMKSTSTQQNTKQDRKSTRLNSSHRSLSRMPSSA